MTLTKKLVSVLLWAGLLTASSINAQEISTTGNVISPSGWSGVTYMNPTQISTVEGCCYWGGPAYNTGTNTIRFSFGKTDTVYQTVNLESAFSSLGTGIKISGFSYRFKLQSAGGDTLIGTFTTKNNAGNSIDTTTINFSGINTNGTFTADEADPHGTVMYDKLYSPSSLSSFTASFLGHDTKWWAGLYGPRVRDFNVGFNYTGGSSTSSGGTSSPIVPKSSTVVEKSNTTTSSSVDSTKTNVTTVNVGGVEMNNGELSVQIISRK